MATRSQAENFIKLGQVDVNGQIVTKPAFQVTLTDKIVLTSDEQYVSRAGLKLASVAKKLSLNFKGKVLLDVGSSTGGFTDYALQHGAAKVIAVDVGTGQLHPSLLTVPKVELHEQTDIRNFKTDQAIDLVVIDVSFVSLRHILPSVRQLCNPKTKVIAMAKPQFEQTEKGQNNRGVIKNDTFRREILKNFEIWVQKLFKIVAKADSEVTGAKGNRERFYLLLPL